MKAQMDLGKLGEEYVKICYGRRYLHIRPVPDNIATQLEWGDIVLPPLKALGIGHKKIEVKTELKDPNGNFFIERWSNKSTGRDGWLTTSPADELFYLFWDVGYGFRFPCWQQSAWMIDYNQYRLVEQKQTDQHNDTWGFLVPHGSLKGPFAPVKFDLCVDTKAQAIINRGKL